MGLTILVYEFPFVRKQINQVSLYSSIKIDFSIMSMTESIDAMPNLIME